MPSPGLPGGECQTQSETCQLDESVIAIKQSVQTIGQCRQYCREKDGCTHFTLFGREEFELVNTCVLFSSCFSTNPCTDCISEDTTRPCHLCSSPVVEGNIGANNLLEFLPNIAEELDCWSACRQVSECMFYSHHTTSHPSFGRSPSPPPASFSATWKARSDHVKTAQLELGTATQKTPVNFCTQTAQ